MPVLINDLRQHHPQLASQMRKPGMTLRKRTAPLDLSQFCKLSCAGLGIAATAVIASALLRMGAINGSLQLDTLFETFAPIAAGLQRIVEQLLY